MELREFEILKEKVQELVRANHSLREERRFFQEKLLLNERQIRELKERCQRYERNHGEASRRIDSILNKLDGLKS